MLIDGTDLVPVQGIYEIYCTATGGIYVGQSVNVRGRLATHFNDLANNRHIRSRMQRDWNTFGPTFFRATIVKRVEDRTLLARLEEAIISRRYVEGANLYNALHPSITPRATERAEKEARSYVLIFKRGEKDGSLNAVGGNSRNGKSVPADGDLQGSGGLPETGASTSLERDQQRVRIEETDIRASGEGSDSATGSSGPTTARVDADGRRGKRDSNIKEALPVFDHTAKARLVGWMTEDYDAERYFRTMYEDLSQYNFAELAYVLRAFFSPEDVETVHDILDPNIHNVWIHADDLPRYEAMLARHGNASLQEMVDFEMMRR